nr:hypothetical protein GCM10020185_14300 [Pseudomonas brassicacearum subsp. brassicacearum]
MNTTDMTVPASVPTNRANPFCTTIPDSGWATMIAVISAHDGCSSPPAQRQPQRQPSTKHRLDGELQSEAVRGKQGLEGNGHAKKTLWGTPVTIDAMQGGIDDAIIS